VPSIDATLSADGGNDGDPTVRLKLLESLARQYVTDSSWPRTGIGGAWGCQRYDASIRRYLDRWILERMNLPNGIHAVPRLGGGDSWLKIGFPTREQAERRIRAAWFLVGIKDRAQPATRDEWLSQLSALALVNQDWLPSGGNLHCPPEFEPLWSVFLEEEKTRSWLAGGARYSGNLLWHDQSPIDALQLRRATVGTAALALGVDVPSGCKIDEVVGNLWFRQMDRAWARRSLREGDGDPSWVAPVRCPDGVTLWALILSRPYKSRHVFVYRTLNRLLCHLDKEATTTIDYQEVFRREGANLNYWEPPSF